MQAAAIYSGSMTCERTPWSRLARVNPATLLFAVALTYVALVSLYDGYLVIRTGDLIEEFEKNPVGLFLIQINGGDPTLFLAAKALGTLAVLAILTSLYHSVRRYACAATFALTVFQSGLLLFLETA
ncbi:MAG: hypothetical protein AB7O26_10395 [Planctomycetaceae bacterium]